MPYPHLQVQRIHPQQLFCAEICVASLLTVNICSGRVCSASRKRRLVKSVRLAVTGQEVSTHSLKLGFVNCLKALIMTLSCAHWLENKNQTPTLCNEC